MFTCDFTFLLADEEKAREHVFSISRKEKRLQFYPSNPCWPFTVCPWPSLVQLPNLGVLGLLIITRPRRLSSSPKAHLMLSSFLSRHPSNEYLFRAYYVPGPTQIVPNPPFLSLVHPSPLNPVLS